MADQTLEFGGKAFTLRFGLKALVALKQRWECADDKALFKRLQAVGLAEACDLIWAAMRSHHAEVHHDEVMSMLDELSVTELTKVVSSLVNDSQPEKKTPAKARAKT